jgi:hypothetical protein
VRMAISGRDAIPATLMASANVGAEAPLALPEGYAIEGMRGCIRSRRRT